MARNGRPDEWSCPLCTLLNAWRDRRCAACDNERPADVETAAGVGAGVAAAPVDVASEEVTMAPRQAHHESKPSFVYRDAPGVFFSSASSAVAWRQVPRLQVNRRRRGVSVRGVACVPRANPSEAKGAEPEPAPWPTHQRQSSVPVEENSHGVADTGSAVSFAFSPGEEADEDGDVPCFNLLGPGMGVFGDPATTGDPVTTNGESPRHVPTYDHTSNAQHHDRYQPEAQLVEARGAGESNGFIPASRLMIQEDRVMEEKLASAGLDLSDSDSDDNADNPHRLRKRKRPLSPIREDDREAGARGSSWECPVCTNFNDAHLSRCELCDTHKMQPNECSICSKILSASATSCDRCGTRRDQGNDLIDLASSQESKQAVTLHRRDDDYGSDFENPYAPAPSNDVDDYPQYLGETGGNYDAVEDISDNEAIPPFSRSAIVRPDLKEFEHFVSVEDLRGDYGCRVNYQSMFTGGRTGKSYADRLAARLRESQKRKRAAAKKDGDAAPSRGAGKPPRQAKPKKATKKGKGKSPTRRRASTGTKQLRKRGTETRRSSAPAMASSVNYYDSSSVDLGDDVRTMAWEGVGSASYY